MSIWGAIVCGAALLLQEAPVPGSPEAVADAAIATFKQAYFRKGVTEDEQVLAIRTLGATAHAKTLAVLAPLMQEGRPISSRIASALVLADFDKVDGTPQVLIKAYQNCERKVSARPVRIRIIQSLGDLKADAASGLFNSAILLDTDPWIVRAAVKAAGRLRGSASIDPLIRRLYHIESKQGDKPPANGGQAPDPSKAGGAPGAPSSEGIDTSKTDRQVLQAPIHEALHSITRQRHTCAETWAKWWAQNRKDYKVPP